MDDTHDLAPTGAQKRLDVVTPPRTPRPTPFGQVRAGGWGGRGVAASNRGGHREESAVKAAETLIAWSPADGAGVHLSPELAATAGEVALLSGPDAAGRAKAYARVLGCCDPCWREADADRLSARLCVAFNTLVVRDRLCPERVHSRFLEIEEYQREFERRAALEAGARAG
jgi:hypothetical protein